MRLMGLIFLFIMLFSSVSNASAIYIKVTDTASTKKLKQVKYTLKRLGLSSPHKTTRTKYIVYSGPYKNSRSAGNALKKIKRYYPYARLIRPNNNNKTKTTTKKQATNKTSVPSVSKSKQDIGPFVGASLGYSSTPLTHTGKFEIFLPKENGISYGATVGNTFKNNIFISANLLRSDTNDLIFNNYYASINYMFGPFRSFSPYIGALIGYSQLIWNMNPLDNTKNDSSNSSESLFVGTQIGAKYKVYEKTSIYINYQCLYMDQTTKLTITTVGTTEEETSLLKHNSLHNLQLGVQYSF